MSDKVDPKDGRLANSGATNLTAGSSALVKRGLEALCSQQPRTQAKQSWQEYGNAILKGLDPPFPIDIQFEELPNYSELARVADSTVWLNRSHPVYQRALASRSLSYHIALSVAMALAPLAVESVNEREFVKSFMSWWGKKAKPEGE